MRKITELLETMDVEDLVKSYFRLGFSNKEILCLLAHQHGVIISKRTLQRLCRKLNLFRRKNQTDIEEIASFVQSEMATSGRWLHLRAIRRGYVVSQETMRMVIKEIDPEGVELRRARRLRICHNTTTRWDPAEVLATSLFFFIINLSFLHNTACSVLFTNYTLRADCAKSTNIPLLLNPNLSRMLTKSSTSIAF